MIFTLGSTVTLSVFKSALISDLVLFSTLLEPTKNGLRLITVVEKYLYNPFFFFLFHLICLEMPLTRLFYVTCIYQYGIFWIYIFILKKETQNIHYSKCSSLMLDITFLTTVQLECPHHNCDVALFRRSLPLKNHTFFRRSLPP